MNTLPTGTVTFLFTDIEGSTPLAQQYPQAMPALLARHHAILREAIQAHNGHVLRVSGDAFVAAFYTAAEALLAALEAQRGLYREVWDPAPIRVRMGIHTGTAQAVVGEQLGDGYVGYLTLTRAQRVMSVAHGGQVLLSGVTGELLRGELPEGVSLRDMGARRLKGLLNPEQLWQLVVPDLRSEFPPLQTLDAFPNNLPAQLNSFVGREREVAEVRDLLVGAGGGPGPARLVTLTGPGGAGKTRLSLQAAAETLEAFKDGVWFVELAPLEDPSLVASTIAQTFRLSESPGKDILETLKDYLREKELLLVLDNFEHVVSAAPLIKELLVVAPEVKALVSSRTLLRLTGEREYPVPLLRTPDPQALPEPERLAQYEAVRLFIDRAQAVKASFTVNNENAPAVAEICYRLDGLPLAIELAAARVRLLTPQKMLAQLSNRLKFLTSAARDLPARQQTLRAALDWSYELLTPEEQLLFRRLAVFAGGATLEAAEAVSNADGAVEVFGGIESLVDKSLLKGGEQGGEPRFSMLGMVREYAREKLGETGELAGASKNHLDFFLALAEQAEAESFGGGELAWLDQLEAEIDNLRSALEWSLANEPHRALRLAGKLGSLWAYRNHGAEGRGWLKSALAGVDQPESGGEGAEPRRVDRALALTFLGTLALLRGDIPTARARLEESQQLLRTTGERLYLAMTLSYLGLAAFLLDDIAPARSVLEEATQLARSLGSQAVHCLGLSFLGMAVFRQTGDYGAARIYLEESVRLGQGLKDGLRQADARLNFGKIAYLVGDYATARREFQASLALFTEIGYQQSINMSRSGLADVAWRAGELELATSLYRKALEAWRQVGNRGGMARVLECLAFVTAQAGEILHSSESDAGIQTDAGIQREAGDRRAALFLGAAQALRADSGAVMTADEQSEYEQELAGLRSRLDPAAFQEAWETGRWMTAEQAVQAAQ